MKFTIMHFISAGNNIFPWAIKLIQYHFFLQLLQELRIWNYFKWLNYFPVRTLNFIRHDSTVIASSKFWRLSSSLVDMVLSQDSTSSFPDMIWSQQINWASRFSLCCSITFFLSYNSLVIDHFTLNQWNNRTIKIVKELLQHFQIYSCTFNLTFSYRNKRFICPLISIRIQQNILLWIPKIGIRKNNQVNYTKIIIYDKTGLIYRGFCKKINRHFTCGCVPH